MAPPFWGGGSLPSLPGATLPLSEFPTPGTRAACNKQFTQQALPVFSRQRNKEQVMV